MPKFSVSVPHALEREEAVVRLKDFSNKVLEDSPVDVTEVEEAWDDSGNLAFSFKAMGMKIAGKVITSGEQVAVDGDIPFAAIAFRGAIETQIEAKIREAIG